MTITQTPLKSGDDKYRIYGSPSFRFARFRINAIRINEGPLYNNFFLEYLVYFFCREAVRVERSGTAVCISAGMIYCTCNHRFVEKARRQ